MRRTSSLCIAPLLLALLAMPAAAHAPGMGMHHGQQVNAGPFHMEAVVNDRTIEIYLVDHASKPIDTAGFKGTAILVIDTTTARIALTPAGENKLSGKADIALPMPLKGVVQVTLPNGGTAQGKF